MMQESTLAAIATDYREAADLIRRRVVLCAGTGCVANGALAVHEALLAALKERDCDVTVELRTEQPEEHDLLLSTSGCQGFCQMGPLLGIEPDGLLYTHVTVEDIPDIVDHTLLRGRAVERLLYVDPATGARCKGQEDIPFYSRQTRRILEECGKLNPEDIREYIAHGGYRGAVTAWTRMDAEGVCREILQSGLRGRGGGGFPTGRKWELARIEASNEKYVICNGDEGDPGAFMDRSVMEGNPHSVIEGMMIAARAIGACEGYVYVRAEYPLAVKRMHKAVEDARALGVLGRNVFFSGSSFDVHVMEGAGAFVCGEETALIASIEGKRGMPMPKPPFPAQSGLWGKPTVINNVETLASVPAIIRDGAMAYRAIGTAESPGTKTFALTGHVENTGLIEVPFGSTLRDIVFSIGGGIPKGRRFKAVQIGGPSGGCLTEAQLDLPLDFDSLRSIGAMVGSGGLVVMDDSTCMVKIARFFMQFAQNESCGKCVLCREGTKQMLALLDDIIEGRGSMETLELLETLGHVIQKGSLCGLGKTAPSPVLSTLREFRAEYEAHVSAKHCPSKACKALCKPEIVGELCKGCMKCARLCPVGAIEGGKKQVHRINPDVCINCGACLTSCAFQAIKGVAA